jgi:hypothetical protein
VRRFLLDTYLVYVCHYSFSYFQLRVFLSYLNLKVHGVFSLIAIVRLITEISTPFVNIRYFLVVFDMKNTKLYVYNGYAMLLTFFLFRVITIVPIWLHFYSLMSKPAWQSLDNTSIYFCVSTMVPVDCLNLFWFKKILAGALKHRKA